MLELIAALWIQEMAEDEAQPVIQAVPGLQAECQLAGEINQDDGVIEDLRPVCPVRAPYYEQLQGAAEALINQLEQPVSLQLAFLRNPVLRYIWYDESWVLESPLPLERHAPNYPPRAAERGINAICAGLVIIQNDGSVQAESWECRGTRRSGRSTGGDLFIRSAEETVGRWTYLTPSDGGPYCVANSLDYLVSDGGSYDEMVANFPEEERPQCPPKPWEIQ